jgi:hypothetical protein
MKNSQALTVKINMVQKADIIIHPNEGFDLGLMNTLTGVKIFDNSAVEVFNVENNDFIEGHVALDNNCKPGTIQVTNRYWKKLGTPKRVILYFDSNKILVSKIDEL